jgi:hypothetical protein
MADKKATAAQIDKVLQLLEETDAALWEVLEEVMFNWDDEAILSLLPAEVVKDVLDHLREVKKAQA